MKLTLSPRLLTAWVLISVGILFWVLPECWIESRFCLSPDGGSGLLEFLLVAIPISVGLISMLVSRKDEYQGL